MCLSKISPYKSKNYKKNTTKLKFNNNNKILTQFKKKI